MDEEMTDVPEIGGENDGKAESKLNLAQQGGANAVGAKKLDAAGDGGDEVMKDAGAPSAGDAGASDHSVSASESAESPGSGSTPSRKRKKEEAASSSPASASSSTSAVGDPSKVVKAGDGSAVKAEHFSPFLLKLYYDCLLPYKEMFRWLSYSNDPSSESPLVDKSFFKRREFSFTLEGDVYIRYRSFVDKDEFRQAIQKRVPYKIDIGAVYNAPPSMHASLSKFVPEEKEFVLDIDMTDYDDVRTCCSGAKICKLCWPLMNAAIAVLDPALRDEDFGFEHLLWVYSGRRGVHCWVCDERARALPNDKRPGIIQFLSVFAGSEDNVDAMDDQLTPKLHPSLQRAFDILEPYFEEISLRNQGYLDSEDTWGRVLGLVPSEELREKLESAWSQNNADGVQRWRQLKKSVDKEIRRLDNRNVRMQGKHVLIRKLRICVPKIVFTFVYPRLDINVSKQLNHLLKSPFCVHPKTGRVCVPIDPNNLESFSPFEVPTLDVLKRELDSGKAAEAADGGGTHKRSSDYTSLKPYIDYFRNGFLTPLEKAINASRREMEQSEF